MISEEVALRLSLTHKIMPRDQGHGIIVGFAENYTVDTYKQAAPPFVYMFNAMPHLMEKELMDTSLMMDVKNIHTYVLGLEMVYRKADSPDDVGIRATASMDTPDSVVYIVNMGKGEVFYFIIRDYMPGQVGQIEAPPSDLIEDYASLAPGDKQRKVAALLRSKYSDEEIQAWMKNFSFVETDSENIEQVIETANNSDPIVRAIN